MFTYIVTCKLSAMVYNVEDEKILRHSNRDARESFSIIISEETSEVMTYFCKFSICKCILKPRIWVRSSRERTSIEKKSLSRSKPGGTQLQIVLHFENKSAKETVNWGSVRNKENHENITKENVEQMGVQEWIGK